MSTSGREVIYTKSTLLWPLCPSMPNLELKTGFKTSFHAFEIAAYHDSSVFLLEMVRLFCCVGVCVCAHVQCASMFEELVFRLMLAELAESSKLELF